MIALGCGHNEHLELTANAIFLHYLLQTLSFASYSQSHLGTKPQKYGNFLVLRCSPLLERSLRKYYKLSLLIVAKDPSKRHMAMKVNGS
jgi:hypothetical protein